MITRGRVIKAAFAVDPNAASPRADERAAVSTADTARAPLAGRGHARRIDGTIVDAYAEAERIVTEARTRADLALADAKKDALAAATTAGKDAHDAAIAKLAASFLAMRAAEEKRAARELAHTTELAKLLAERLLGEELRLDPTRIADLAKSALKEARGARRAKIRAAAEDATPLVEKLASLGMPEGAVEVCVDESLTRGSLILETDLGVLDARLEPQLDRLTETLRDVLRGA